ncbi:MAG: rhomboid family intramembrane serine protease [Clostridia bacterium]|nr:rhomboid family intramembrane serine protease [Clostridia bacterium]
MKWLNKLERAIGRHYIPNLMKYLCFAMLGVFVLDYLYSARMLTRSASELLMFSKDKILQGEVWRTITFIFLPPNHSFLFILLSLYFYYFLGTTLENHWGSARFNIYYAIGILGNIVAGFIMGYATNEYLNLSLLLAIAVLYPDMEIMLFFILPVKLRWIGYLDAALLVYGFVLSPWPVRLAMVLSLLPFFLFFGQQAWLQLRMDWRRLLRWIRAQK